MERVEQEGTGTLTATVERLAAAAEMLERAAEQLTAGQRVFREEMESTVARIVATSERSQEMVELEGRLQAALGEIEALKAQREAAPAEVRGGRKTLSAGTVRLLAKQGVAAEGGVELAALDAALGSLSIEQRIAVKSQLQRAGALTRF